MEKHCAKVTVIIVIENIHDVALLKLIEFIDYFFHIRTYKFTDTGVLFLVRIHFSYIPQVS